MNLITETEFLKMAPAEQKQYLIDFVSALPDEDAKGLFDFMMEDENSRREFEKHNV